MENVSIHVRKGSTSIHVGEQHLSRLSDSEVRHIVTNLLVFGGKELREKIKNWLTDGTIANVAEYIAPDSTSSDAMVSGKGNLAESGNEDEAQS